jgi:hypothetical protein
VSARNKFDPTCKGIGSRRYCGANGTAGFDPAQRAVRSSKCKSIDILQSLRGGLPGQPLAWR